jgi:hypothetical protein
VCPHLTFCGPLPPRRPPRRRPFQAEDESTGTELGMIGSSNTGKVRMTLAKDTQKLGRKAAHRLAKAQRGGGGGGGGASMGYGAGMGMGAGGATAGAAAGAGGARLSSASMAGTQTTLALTAKQGIELVDPTLAAARAREKLMAEGTATYVSEWGEGGRARGDARIFCCCCVVLHDLILCIGSCWAHKSENRVSSLYYCAVSGNGEKAKRLNLFAFCSPILRARCRYFSSQSGFFSSKGR